MALLHVNEQNFHELEEKDAPVLLDFYADWCGPCRMVAPLLEQLAEEDDSLIIAKINVDDCPELAKKFGIVSIPTLVVIKGKQEVRRATGARPKDQIRALLAD